MTGILEKYPDLSDSAFYSTSPEEEYVRLYEPRWEDLMGNVWEIEIVGPPERVYGLRDSLKLMAIPLDEAGEQEEAKTPTYADDDEDTFPVPTPQPSLSVSIRLKELSSPGEPHILVFHIDPELPHVEHGPDSWDQYAWWFGSDEFNINCHVRFGVVGVSASSWDSSTTINRAPARQAVYPLKAEGGPWYGVSVWWVGGDRAVYVLSGDRNVLVEVT